MQTIVGVLRGGPSREHDVSLKTGAAILANLPEERFAVRDIYIDKQGQWHDRGRVTEPQRALRQIDVAFVGLHGEYGEDGEVQKLLERFGVPYTGSNSFSSYLAMHKLMAKMHAKENGLRFPEFRHIEHVEDSEAVVHDITRSFHQPVVVKPVGWGSSIGISVVGGYAAVLSAIQKLFSDGARSVLVEEYIRGQEATIGIVEDFREEELYALPAIEIIPPAGDFFSYDSKYSGATREVCPGNFSRVTVEELQRLARVMHHTLGLRHYSRSDFIVAPSGIYYLETNTLPGLTSESLMPKSLAAVGVTLSDFLSHVVNLALGRETSISKQEVI
jgi:D-alanine-D-alanine ligase